MNRKHRNALAIRDAIRNQGGEFRSCLTKKAYNSEKGARMAVEMHPEKAGHRYYHCPNCGKWHTTKVEKYDFGGGSF